MAPDTANPFATILDRQPIVVLDGGLATALEDRGHELQDALWSARLLRDHPDEIAAVITDYLEAGADCVATASYQATVEGFVRAGASVDEAEALLDRSVSLAVEARDAFMACAPPDRPRPLVAASVGPYGAFLADGSEYTGDYGVSIDTLREFHGDRLRRFARSEADLIGCETVPSAEEGRVLAALLDEAERWGWISFSCADGGHLNDGTPVEDAVAGLAECSHLAAVGVNCTRPEFVAELMERMGGVSTLPLMAYPNSGEGWDATEKVWTGQATEAWTAGPAAWITSGARIVGGCCRVGPATISDIRKQFVE